MEAKPKPSVPYKIKNIVVGDDSDENGKLGSGNYGEVYKGKWQKEGSDDWEDVAVKQQSLSGFIAKFPTEKDGKKKIKAEIDALNDLQSEFIVGFREFKILPKSDLVLIVMELCDPTTLEDKMEDEMTDDQIKPIIHGLLQGYEQLEKKNILHRDIKPENILFKGDTPKIADLGLCKHIETEQAQDQGLITITGNPKYRAPEIQGDDSERVKLEQPNKVDIWSLGYMFYEMFHQQLPWEYDEGDISEQLEQIQKQPIEECDFKEGLDVNAKELLIKMLQLDPKNRITAQEALQHPYFK